MVHFVIRFDLNAGPPQVIVDDHPQYWSRIRHADECLARDVLWIDRLMRSEAPCRFAGSLDLSQRQSCMVEKDPTRGGQLDASSTANHQLSADLVLKVPDLTPCAVSARQPR